MKTVTIFFGLIILFEGFLLFFGIDVIGSGGRTIKATSESGIFHIILGISIITLSKLFIKNKTYSKCPKCKEAFNYNELEDGKCKYCKNVDTVDIKQYYKHNQHKQDEKI